MSMIVQVLAALLLLGTSHISPVLGEDTGINVHKVQCVESERLALVTFKQGLLNPYNYLSFWTDSTHHDCCTWNEITCDNRTNHVIILDLSDYGVGGVIGASLLELQYLEQLHLRGNDFARIPNFIGSFKRLAYLDLAGNPIRGAIPSQLGNLTKLQFLSFGSGKGAGQMIVDGMEWLSHLTSLTYFELHGANFTKAVFQSFKMPPSLSTLELWSCQFPEAGTSSLSHINSSDSLKTLHMFHNSVHSTTVNWFLNSSKLVDLALSNFMIGTINPSQLRKLTKLKFLHLGRMIVDRNLEVLSHIPSLTTFKLSDVNLTKDELQSFKIPTSFLVKMELEDCQFPEMVSTSSLFTTNSSNSLTSLVLLANTIHPRVLAWLLNSVANLVDLTISSNFIDGSLPNSFQKMNSLEHIDISFNDGLGNQIPTSLGNLTNLQTLHLNGNNLNGTLEHVFQGLSGFLRNSLQILDLSENRLLGGFILRGDKTFPSLRMLDLSRNLLEGPLPDLSTLSSLREFYASNNRFNDTLTESIGQLHNLQSLDVSSNSLSGIVSEVHFQKLSNLKKLDLSSNPLAFRINSDWVPPFQLTDLSLRSCKLGPEFPGWLHNQSYLYYLDISNSGISGAIPSWFSDLTFNTEILNLSFNQISSSLTNFVLRSNSIPLLDLRSNQFHGPVPPSLSNAAYLHLSNNKFSGLRSFLCDIKDGFPTLLDLSNNLLSGSLPNCWLNLKDLEVLNLENNELSGVIPSSISMLYQLTYLNLRKNNFSGSLPSRFQNCTKLQVLDVGENNLKGEIPTWIGARLINLVLLSLKSNRFYGSLPSNLCHLQFIQILDLSINRLSGPVLSCIDKFTSMVQHTGDQDKTITLGGSYGFYDTTALITWKGVEYTYKEILGLLRIVDLSCNRLIGEIPEELASLAELNELNLSRNNLSGVIPKKIGMLSKIESLDLSHNKLSGKIPTSLAQVSTLAYLDLSDNQLSGRIPTSTQLQSFNASAYTGNLQLCGQPLTPTCPGDETPEGPSITDESNDDDDDDSGEWYDMSWLRMGIGAGFAVGFCGVCANLLLVTTWRLAYFRFLDGMGDWLYVIVLVKWAKLKRRLST